MQTLTGKYNTAKVFTDNIEETASKQIIELMNQEFTSGAKIRIMSDVHAGAGCVIGFTADLGNKVIPNLVGVDLGCGIFTLNLGKQKFDLSDLDNIIKTFVPAGHNIHETQISEFGALSDLICLPHLKNGGKFLRAIGTLGGGNHFIEIDKDENDNQYLVIHSGSRNLGKQVAEYYQNMAVQSCTSKVDLRTMELEIIRDLKDSEQTHLIPNAIFHLRREYKNSQPAYPKDLCFLENEQRDEYLHDMRICQEYASLNRFTMAYTIIDRMFIGASVYDFEYFMFEEIKDTARIIKEER